MFQSADCFPDLSAPVKLQSQFTPCHLSCLFVCSAEWEQSFSHVAKRCSIHSQWLQQRASHVLDGLAVQPAAPARLRSPAALQTEALPDDAAAVRKRHLARDRRESAQPRVGPGGKLWSSSVSDFGFFPTTKTAKREHFSAPFSVSD